MQKDKGQVQGQEADAKQRQVGEHFNRDQKPSWAPPSIPAQRVWKLNLSQINSKWKLNLGEAWGGGAAEGEVVGGAAAASFALRRAMYCAKLMGGERREPPK